MLTVTRGGRYHRVADPTWSDPLDAEHAARRGGRWNPPGSFPTSYLCRTRAVARANVHRLLADQPYGPEDLDPGAAPILVDVDLLERERLDVISPEGCAAVSLPATYPRDGAGERIGHELCQPVGRLAWDAGLAGVAALSAWADGEELAHFVRDRSLRPVEVYRRAFEEWFWPRDR